MIHAWRTLRSTRGTALLTGIMVMMMVAMFGCAYIALTSNNLLRANRDLRRTTAFYLAEAGLEHSVATLMTQAQAGDGTIYSQSYNTTALLDSLSPGSSGNVNIVTGSGGGKIAVVTSSATYRNITETVRVLVEVRNIGVWDNAIFAGIGQSGRGINGNVDIRGSVHILGDGEPFFDLNGNGVWDDAEPFTDLNGNGVWDPGEPFIDLNGNGVWDPAEPFIDVNGNGVYDPPLTATDLAGDLGGSAHIGNNYSGIPAALQAKIPMLSPQLSNGEMVYTLGAEVRVKHGKVNLSGTATIGKPHVSGNLVKETVDGVYVSDGFGGNQGTGNVYSDNGTNQGYDLGDRLSFPNLIEPYTDPSTGINYSTYESYLESNSYPVSGVVVEDRAITSSTPSFTRSDGAGNSITWNQDTMTMTVSGIVRFNKDLDLGEKGKTINFTGRGTVYVKGNIRVRGDVMPVNTFPTEDVIGFISRGDIDFATGSGEAQLMAVGAWYAQGTIRSAKQSQFAGTYVANYFDMGTNVPNIYQVPSLAQNLPPGMPGSEQIVAARIQSWKHVRPHI